MLCRQTSLFVQHVFADATRKSCNSSHKKHLCLLNWTLGQWCRIRTGCMHCLYKQIKIMYTLHLGCQHFLLFGFGNIFGSINHI